MERITKKLDEVKEKQQTLVKERNEVYLEAKNKIKNLEDEIAKITGSIQTLTEMVKEIEGQQPDPKSDIDDEIGEPVNTTQEDIEADNAEVVNDEEYEVKEEE